MGHRREARRAVGRPKCASPRPYPARLSPLEYPGPYEVRRVSRNGGIRWHKQWVNVSQTLGEEYVGLVEIDDGEWDRPALPPAVLANCHPCPET